MTNITWASVKSVILHVGIVFVAAFATAEAATGWSTAKSAITAGITAGAAAVLHYVAGLLPNADASANRAEAARAAAAPPA